MKSLFVMDPLHKIQVSGDSTYVTMRECSDRGFACWYCTPDQLFAQDGKAWATATAVRTTAEPPFFHTEAPKDLCLDDVDVVWMRKDPPFDMNYVFTTYLLDMTRALVVNGAEGLKLFSEKMWAAAEFSAFQPAHIISNDAERVRAFVADHGRSVLKPWDGNGGRGVVVTEPSDRNLRSMIDILTDEGRAYVIAQAFIPDVETHGDKRILLFDGEPVEPALLRMPTQADFRANMHVGGRVEAVSLDDRDREICAAMAPKLREYDQIFVGIDVIGGQLTEINVTSPTGIRELNRLAGLKLEADLVDRVSSRIEKSQ